MPILLLLATLISVVTTLGIVFTLIFETFEFFREYQLSSFYLEQNGIHFQVAVHPLVFYHSY